MNSEAIIVEILFQAIINTYLTYKTHILLRENFFSFLYFQYVHDFFLICPSEYLFLSLHNVQENNSSTNP